MNYQPRYRAWLRAQGLPEDQPPPHSYVNNIRFMNFIDCAWKYFCHREKIHPNFIDPTDPRFDALLARHAAAIWRLTQRC